MALQHRNKKLKKVVHQCENFERSRYYKGSTTKINKDMFNKNKLLEKVEKLKSSFFSQNNESNLKANVNINIFDLNTERKSNDIIGP